MRETLHWSTSATARARQARRCQVLAKETALVVEAFRLEQVRAGELVAIINITVRDQAS
jgi:hypothetical protein